MLLWFFLLDKMFLSGHLFKAYPIVLWTQWILHRFVGYRFGIFFGLGVVWVIWQFVMFWWYVRWTLNFFGDIFLGRLFFGRSRNHNLFMKASSVCVLWSQRITSNNDPYIWVSLDFIISCTPRVFTWQPTSMVCLDTFGSSSCIWSSSKGKSNLTSLSSIPWEYGQLLEVLGFYRYGSINSWVTFSTQGRIQKI